MSVVIHVVVDMVSFVNFVIHPHLRRCILTNGLLDTVSPWWSEQCHHYDRLNHSSLPATVLPLTSFITVVGEAWKQQFQLFFDFDKSTARAMRFA